MRRRHFGALLAACIALPLVAMAQPNAERRDRARTFLVVRIAEALKLGDEDALKVSKILRQADEHRQELLKQRQGLEDQLQAALAKQPPDTATLAKLVAQGNDLDQKLALVPEENFRELQKTLTVEQQARLLLFRREMQGEIRRAIQGRRAGGRFSRRGAGTPPSTE